jgi:hypothetical protein
MRTSKGPAVSLPLWLGLALSLFAAGCAKAPPPTVPAMVPRSANGDYGYSETQLGPDLYTVTFVSPSLPAPGSPEFEYGLGGQKARVHALALWRAAQLALANDYPAFRIESESRDIDVTVVDPPPPPPYVSTPLRTLSGPPCRYDCDDPVGYWDDAYFNPRYDEWYRRAHSFGRARATLTVRMLPALAPGAVDAAATAESLRTAYAASTFQL